MLSSNLQQNKQKNGAANATDKQTNYKSNNFQQINANKTNIVK